MFGKRGAALTLGSLLLVGSSLVWAPAGRAGTGRHEDHEGGFLCTGSSRSHYDPPLILEPRLTRVRADVTYSSCTVRPGRTVAATSSFDGVSPAASCLTLSGGSGEETVQYADGRRSLIVYDSSRILRAAGVLALVQSGRVTEGRGKGHPARRTITGAPRELPTDCLAPGLREGDNEVQLEIQP
ncbi:hypothetical protein AB0L26_00305 [Streptomyces nondiastaticus]|uniref:hypothetical protein n=1 Tax=Streptomyces nondiastaticus TaxID=3154512 RepID=UPI0034481F87